MDENSYETESFVINSLECSDNDIQDVEEYEKCFIERYLTAQAEKEIEILRKKMDGSKKESTKNKYKIEIQKVRNKLVEDIENYYSKEKNEIIHKNEDFSIKNEEYLYKDIGVPAKIYEFLFPIKGKD